MTKYFNELVCPECEEPLTAEDLQKNLVCPHCKNKLRDPKYIEFLEYLVAQGIVEDIDFFDTDLYGSDFMKYETNELDEEDITDVEAPQKPGGFLSNNMMSVEEEYIKDIDEDQDTPEDYTVFDPSEIDDMSEDDASSEDDDD
ncbi:TPA: hypothetical protein DCG86_08585 [Candidatus Marinimicrobia bacterium]|nr:MAG: hypothetical protein XD77_1078 [Marinimicrobia bacterium 46_47]KUK93140.1 MAG: hypothetical protein XE04_0344 [Marinimicrobia bacterium 46_43]HAE88063.1 hypothetical protein [Candidatus Neomarinimicrobiota bacterium]HBY18461.1 hypothetical protein [Candidatus Neomarinimicrobiota bacterium]